MSRAARVRAVVLVTITAGLVFLLGAGGALGADLLGGKVRVDDSVVVPSGETVDHDLYVAARTATIDGKVNGDVVVVGGTITIRGAVAGEVIAAGGTITIDGPVGSAVRVAGGQVYVNGAVARDVLVGSGTLDVSGPVGGDLVFTTGTATVAGAVNGSVEGNASTYNRSGSVGGTEHVTINQPSQAPTIARDPVLDAAGQFIAVLLLGLLALLLLPRATAASEATVRERPVPAFAAGILAMVGYVVAFIAILIVSIVLAILLGVLHLAALVVFDLLIGFLALGVISLVFALWLAFLADVVVSLSIGRLLLPAIGMKPTSERWQEAAMLAAGAVIIVVLTSLPTIGGLVKLLVILFGLGAATLVAWERLRGPRRPAGLPTWGSPPTASPG